MAPIVYEVNRLSAEELVYELVIRGISELDTVDAMRKTLRSLLRLEREGQSLDYPAYPFKVAEDIKELNDKVSEMQALLQDFDGSNQNTYKKLLSKYAYALGRANRVLPDNESDKLQKSKVLVAILNFKSDLDKKVRSYEKSLSNKTKGVLDLDMLNISTSSDSDSSVVDEPLGKPNFESTRVHVPVTPKPIPVSHWNLKFSGKLTDLSVNAFLERVDELKTSRHVSDSELFNSAYDLFSDIALIWYRGNKQKASDWKSLTQLLRQEFLPKNYNDILFKQIKERTQHPEEPMGIFIAYMNNHFQRLTVKIPDSVRLKILLENMAPFYKIGLALHMANIKTIDELLELSRELEANRLSVNEYVPPPPKSKNTLERDLACIYSQPSTSQCSAVYQQKEIRCYRCNGIGHIAINCSNNPRRYCYRCKNPNFTVRTCPKCNVNSKNF
ncbi:hypothetical protein RN001_010056 [Aquatica leii]|uniref:CCHC-type domain-containing protein n=1 Tax=Aquatica leii TaxID=1421715 RepID=A0AAN7Q2Y2_9COLE|nr:hypothetical protein RN001_010056 [Aquatica leii]